MRRVKYTPEMPSGLVEMVQKMPFEIIPDGAGEARGIHAKPGWIHGLGIMRLFVKDQLDLLDDWPTIALLVLQHAQHEHRNIQQVMVNKLTPGAVLEKHRDGEPAHFRWHYPVITGQNVTWWDELEGPIHMAAGEWWGPVNYCGVMHSMANRSPFSRVHIIVDLL